MPTLLEIAELEDIVLFDSSANPAHYLLDAIYEARQYAQLNRNVLIMAQADMQQFLGFLYSENVFINADSVQHLEIYQSKLAHKQKFLNQRQKELCGTGAASWKSKKELLDTISSMVFEMMQLAKRKVFTPADLELYAKSQELIPHILERKGITMDIPQEHAGFYAAALYASLAENKKVGFVGNGTELGRGLEIITYALISSTPDSPLRHYPITHYTNSSGNGFVATYTTKK